MLFSSWKGNQPWNAGRIVGAKLPLKPKHVCAISSPDVSATSHWPCRSKLIF
jgi:hypothetical protein